MIPIRFTQILENNKTRNVFIMPTKIVAFGVLFGFKQGSCITIGDGEDAWYRVLESPEEICELLERARNSDYPPEEKYIDVYNGADSED